MRIASTHLRNRQVGSPTRSALSALAIAVTTIAPAVARTPAAGAPARIEQAALGPTPASPTAAPSATRRPAASTASARDASAPNVTAPAVALRGAGPGNRIACLLCVGGFLGAGGSTVIGALIIAAAAPEYIAVCGAICYNAFN